MCLPLFYRNSCVLVKQLSAESNNNSLIRETGPAGEQPSRALFHSPSGLMRISHVRRKIRQASFSISSGSRGVRALAVVSVRLRQELLNLRPDPGPEHEAVLEYLTVRR